MADLCKLAIPKVVNDGVRRVSSWALRNFDNLTDNNKRSRFTNLL